MKMKVVKSTKQVMGVEPTIGSEWDAGYIPSGSAYHGVRVTVRKDAENLWTVYCIGRKGDEILVEWSIAEFDCETCAKAFALCLVFGKDYAGCIYHLQDAFDEGDLLCGTERMLLSAMGINPEAWTLLDEGSRHRVLWTARELLDGRKEWGKVIANWDAALEFSKERRLSLNSTISDWQARLNQ